MRGTTPLLLTPVAAVLAVSIGWAEEVAGVPGSPEQVEPIGVGATIPAVTLKTPDGEAFDLSAAVGEKPTILIYYRGGW